MIKCRPPRGNNLLFYKDSLRRPAMPGEGGEPGDAGAEPGQDRLGRLQRRLPPHGLQGTRHTSKYIHSNLGILKISDSMYTNTDCKVYSSPYLSKRGVLFVMNTTISFSKKQLLTIYIEKYSWILKYLFLERHVCSYLFNFFKFFDLA